MQYISNYLLNLKRTMKLQHQLIINQTSIRHKYNNKIQNNSIFINLLLSHNKIIFIYK